MQESPSHFSLSWANGLGQRGVERSAGQTVANAHSLNPPAECGRPIRDLHYSSRLVLRGDVRRNRWARVT